MTIEEAEKIIDYYLKNSAYKEMDSNFYKNGGWEVIDLKVAKAIEVISKDRKRLKTENYVNKDKIREKIEEIEERDKNDCLALHGFQREAKIDVLQELLKEGE